MFYLKLAYNNIKKNRRTYVPFLISMIFLMVINVVMQVLLNNKGMETLPSAQSAKSMFELGATIILFFTVIFSLYTNSFLLKQRKKELGLYNILGMGKKELTQVLFCETLLAFVMTAICGIGLGAVFSKFSFLIFRHLTGYGEEFMFGFPTASIGYILLVFLGVFILLFLWNVVQLKSVNPINLFKGSQYGEKEPKANWLTAILGVGCLLGGYIISVSIASPIRAISLFFVAVLLVIVGTYALFTSSSIALLKLLKRNKDYYYQPNHFISVSSMMYRMKQNAVGLASICILCTMVLVTISTTASLYFGMENLLRNRNPYDLLLDVPEQDQETLPILKQLATDNGLEIEKIQEMVTSESFFLVKKDASYIPASQDGFSMDELSNGVGMVLLSEKEYNRLTGATVSLNEYQVMVHSLKNEFSDKQLYLGEMSFEVVEILPELSFIPQVEGISEVLFVVMNNEENMKRIITTLYPDQEPLFSKDIYLNFSGEDTARMTFAQAAKSYLREKYPEDNRSFSSIDIDREDMKDFSGGFLFLGCVFGFTFTLATGLILYYKQISEGTQDQERFDIMQRVGMSHDEVKQSIRSQVLTVFFFPIALASMHLAFAFPMMRKLLLLFGLSDWKFYLAVCGMTVAAFFVIYLLMYVQTSKVYYGIVERKAGNI